MGMDAISIQRTAVVGGGLMGAGFAHIMAQAGCEVNVLDLGPAQLDRCLQRVKASLATFVESGLMEPTEVEPVLGRISFTTSMEDAVNGAQFIMEAVVEDLSTKQEVFEKLDRVAAGDAILATNTSGLSVSEIAARTRHPWRVVGSHFFYPHTVVPLVEVGYGRATTDQVVATTVEFWRRCGKEPVVCRRDSNGFIVNRIQSAIVREACSIISKGVASTADVDKALRLGIGVRLALVGSLEQRDWGGLDSHYTAARSIYPTLENAREPLPFLADKVASGEIGAKAGKGFYDWTGKDVDALRRKKQDQLIALLAAIQTIMPEEEELVENV